MQVELYVIKHMLKHMLRHMAGHMLRHTAGLTTEVSQVLFRLSRWENLEYAKKI